MLSFVYKDMPLFPLVVLVFLFVVLLLDLTAVP